MNHPVCPNCETPLKGPYCHQCGQKQGPALPKLSEFVHGLTGEFLHLDSGWLRTIRAALTQPGQITLDYFAGRRSRYLAPIKFYLLSSAIFFAAGAATNYLGNVAPELNFRDSSVARDNLALALALEGSHRYYLENLELIYIVAVPFTAFATVLLFRKQKLPLSGHFVMSLHIFSVSFLLTAPALFAPNIYAVSIITLLIALVYSILMFRRLFDLRWFSAIWRGFAYMYLSFLLSTVIYAGVVLIHSYTNANYYKELAKQKSAD